MALAVAACVLAAGCGGTTDDAGPAGVSSAVSTPPSGELTPTDVAFVELVIPQNESTLAALALARKRSDSTLLALADQVETRYRTELDGLHDLLAEAGRQESKQHEGHP